MHIRCDDDGLRGSPLGRNAQAMPVNLEVYKALQNSVNFMPLGSITSSVQQGTRSKIGAGGRPCGQGFHSSCCARANRVRVSTMKLYQILFLILCALYFLPSMVAAGRHHNSTAAIIALNLLLGWTGLGWIASLVWSLTGNTVSSWQPSNPESISPSAAGRSNRFFRRERDLFVLIAVGIIVVVSLVQTARMPSHSVQPPKVAAVSIVVKSPSQASASIAAPGGKVQEARASIAAKASDAEAKASASKDPVPRISADKAGSGGDPYVGLSTDQIFDHIGKFEKRLAESNRPKPVDQALNEPLITNDELSQAYHALAEIVGTESDPKKVARALALNKQLQKDEMEGKAITKAAVAKALNDDVQGRKTYAQELENNFLNAGYDVYVTLSGRKDTTLNLRFVLFSRPLVYKLTRDDLGRESDFVSNCRLRGFEKIVFSDGYATRWTLPLKNPKN